MREIVKARKQNMKIYSLYRMLSLDHIFFYAIDFLFLTQVKNISAADIVFGQSCYAFFVILLQIPAIILIEKIGNRNSMVLSNIFLALYVLIIMNCIDIRFLILAQFVDAMGFSIKDTADASLLNSSIPESSKKGEIHSQIEGKGLKNYYYFSAIASIIAGLAYEINVYIPITISFLISVCSAIMALGFKDIKIKKDEKENEKFKVSEYFKDLKESFKFIFMSKRLKALLLYSGITWAVISLMSTYTTSILKDIGAGAIIIAIYISLKEIASGAGSKKQLDFHNKYRNKSLTKILIIILSTIWITGILGLTKGKFVVLLTIIVIAALIRAFVKGIHLVLSSRYLQNFSNPQILPKIYAVNTIIKNVCRIIVGCVGSYFLRITNTANSIILLAIIFTIIVIVLISYMKTRLGLKPEEYEN